MFGHHRDLLVSVFAAIITLALPAVVCSQVTTGTLTGSVSARNDSSALPGVQIEAVHVPTGTRYSSVSGPNGRYTIPNVRVGGPYTISANLEGFKPATVNNVTVALGTATEVPITLTLATVAEAITVTATSEEVINPNRTGSASTVSQQQIERLPTVNRSLQDFARTNPYFNVDPTDDSGTIMNVAGRNKVYNTLQIDGAVNNDLFGLADSGTPGGQTGTQPISLDAVQQLQLVVSPYDVRQSGFTGGGINAVTRSGSNDIQGSVFGTKRSQSFVGKGPFDSRVASFSQNQYGGRIGGPILHDRLFFFASGEVNRRHDPTGISADNSTGQVFFAPADAARLRQDLISRYQYDPGSLGDLIGKTNSDLAFVRFDWNANPENQITFRHNYVKGLKDVTDARSTDVFNFPTDIYTIADKTNSTVAQVNSVFGPSAFNEGRIGYQTIRDVRVVPVIFPSIEIGGDGPRSGSLLAGTERFSGANALDQNVLELTDDFTLIRGNHTIIVGTHNEFFKFKNLFLSDFYGYYYFPTLDAFEARMPTEYRIGFANGSNPRRPTSFGVRQYGLYANDQWHISNLTLTAGLRADKPSFNQTPSFNPTVLSAVNYNTAVRPGESVVLSPRFGFNWRPSATANQELRGGIGVFAGRPAYVWISNAYANTGVESTALSCDPPDCTPPLFNPDVTQQPRNLGSGGTLSADLIAPNFKFPRVLRSTLGYDTILPWGIRGTIEALYSKTMEDVYYSNVNRVQTGTSPLDGRPTYSNVSSQIADAILLSNTNKGHEFTQTLQLNKEFGTHTLITAAYAHQDAKAAFDPTSSRAISNWQFEHSRGDIFHPELATSAFEMKHRFNVAASETFSIGSLGQTLSLYYNAQSGHPYSLLISGDPNRDGYSTNDLLYVPASSDAIILKDASGAVIPYTRFADFLRYAGINPTAGRILNRYESREPWARELDLHYAIDLPILRERTEVSLDMLNLMNLFDKNSGVIQYVGHQNWTPVAYRGQDAATGKPIYQERFPGAMNPGRQLTTADLRSRWQARLGLRVSF